MTIAYAYQAACLSFNRVSKSISPSLFPWRRRIHTVVAKTLSRGANFGVVANVATLVAGTTRERRHLDNVVRSSPAYGVSRRAGYFSRSCVCASSENSHNPVKVQRYYIGGGAGARGSPENH